MANSQVSDAEAGENSTQFTYSLRPDFTYVVGNFLNNF